MADVIIRDGSSGRGATVNVDGEVKVRAHTDPSAKVSAEDGNSYILTSGKVAIGASGTEGILYFKNSDTVSFHLQSIDVSNDVATDWVFRKNPTTGTLISGGDTVVSLNTNFSSGKSITETSRIGTDASTVTDGDDFAAIYLAANDHGELDYQGAIIIGPTDSISAESTVGAAASVVATFHFYEEAEE